MDGGDPKDYGEILGERIREVKRDVETLVTRRKTLTTNETKMIKYIYLDTSYMKKNRSEKMSRINKVLLYTTYMVIK